MFSCRTYRQEPQPRTPKPDLAPVLEPDHKSTNEYMIKSAFIYKFLKYIDWPEDKADQENIDRIEDPPRKKEITLGLYSDKRVYDICRKLEDKTIKNRKIRIIRLTDKDLFAKNLKALKKLDILYLAKTPPFRKETDLKKFLANFKGQALLTIGETSKFLEQGGIINFMKEGNHIKFEINLNAARQAHFKIRTSMLELAKRVIKK